MPRQRKAKQQPPETKVEGAFVAQLAPLLMPIIGELVTAGITNAIKPQQAAPKAALAVRDKRTQPKSTGAGGVMEPTKATQGTNAAPGARVKMSVISKTTRGVVMRFQDEIGDVTIPASAWGTCLAAGAASYTFVSPINAWLHPVSSTEAQYYLNWQPKRIKLSFVPTAGDTQQGTIVMGYVDNPQSAPLADSLSAENKAMANPFNKIVQANLADSLVVSGLRSWTKQEYEVGASAATDQRDITPGCVFCYATFLDASTHKVGKLFIEADYELMDRRAPYTGAGLAMALYSAAGNARTEEDRARVRARLVSLVDHLVVTINQRLQCPPDTVEPGLSETEMKAKLAKLPQLLTPPPQERRSGY